MPAKPVPITTPSRSALADATVELQESELTAAGRELAEDLGASGVDEPSSPAAHRAAERTARRRERAEARGQSSHRGSGLPQARVVTPAAASTLRESLPAAVIAVIAGGVLGVILGALSAEGWIIGLLVAGLTVILLRALGWHSRSTRTGAE
jgi:uncharacterized membrane protein YdbT with pleckstrin-like domain